MRQMWMLIVELGLHGLVRQALLDACLASPLQSAHYSDLSGTCLASTLMRSWPPSESSPAEAASLASDSHSCFFLALPFTCQLHFQ